MVHFGFLPFFHFPFFPFFPFGGFGFGLGPLLLVGLIVWLAVGRRYRYSSPPSFSDDGLWWWDGQRWLPAISADGKWKWNGHAWEPVTA